MGEYNSLEKLSELAQKAGELKEKDRSSLWYNWKDQLIKDDKGKITNCIENYLTFFNESPRYKGQLKYNEFLQQKEFCGKEWTDFDEDQACVDIESEIGLGTTTKVKTAISSIFNNNRYNPVQDYLKSLKWDGQKRIEEVFIKLLEADDTPLYRVMSKKWFMAAVKRVMFPGCKFDNILIFQGAQGIGKTTICERISKGFSKVILLSEISNKDIIDKLNKTWVGIVDEMDAFSKKDMTTIKTFLSTSNDTTRLAYGRNTQTFSRHCVFIGSTNDSTFLRDSTSSTERRFWIMKANRKQFSPIVNELLSEEYVNQLWAEAYYDLMEDVNQYLDIEAELQEDFANTQIEFKTFNDDNVIDWIKEILNKPYVLVNGEFNDNNDFLRQFQDEVISSVPMTYINKIPMSSLAYVLKNVHRESRNAKYIAMALKPDWEYKVIWYKGSSHWGLCRKEKNNDIINTSGIKEDQLPI